MDGPDWSGIGLGQSEWGGHDGPYLTHVGQELVHVLNFWQIECSNILSHEHLKCETGVHRVHIDKILTTLGQRLS